MIRQSSKQQTREKLLDQGVALLMEHGYHGTGLQGLLNGIGVPKGSFYNYFPSKEAFCAEAVRHYIEPFIHMLDDWLERPGLDAAQALAGYFNALIEESERRRYAGGCLLGNLMGEIGDTSSLGRQALEQAVQRYQDKLAEGLARGQQEGVFRQDWRADDMASLMVNSWQGAMLRMKIEQSVRPLRECCDFLLDGCFKP